MFNNLSSVNNPLLEDIYADLTPQELHQYDLYGQMQLQNNSTFKQARDCEELDQPFPYAQIDETAESYSNQYENLRRNAYQEMHYNNMQMNYMMNFDRNRNSTKMYNNFGPSYSKEFNQNVASPTISSSCEPEKVSGTIQAGLTGNENLVHSTTNNSQSQTTQADDLKPPNADSDIQVKEEKLNDLKSTSGNHSENSSILGATKLEEALPHELSVLGRLDAQAGPIKVKASEKSAEASRSSSPGVRQAAKKLRVINSPSDIIEDIRETYAYLQGASFYDNPSMGNSYCLPAVPFKFSTDHYQDNNVNAPIDRDKLSFNFANASDVRFGMQHHVPGYYSNQNSFGPSNGAGNSAYMSNSAHPPSGGNYAMYSQSTYPSTPSKTKLQSECLQIPRTPTTSMGAQNNVHCTRAKPSEVAERPSYCDDAKYTMSPRKTPLTYHNLDDPSDSGLPQRQPPSNLYPRNYAAQRQGVPLNYPVNPVVRAHYPGHPLVAQNEPEEFLSNNEEMQRVLHNGKIHNHPLHPLLENIIIFDMNFPEVAGPFSFINNLPEQFDELVRNYYQKNRISPSSVRVDSTVDAMVIKATKFAHKTIIEKIKREKLKKEKMGGYLVNIQKQPAPDINGLCDVMSKTNDLGMSGNSDYHQRLGPAPTQQQHSSPLDLENHSMISAPHTSPVSLPPSTYYPPNQTYPPYQDHCNNPMTSTHNDLDSKAYPPGTPSSKMRQPPFNSYYTPVNHGQNFGADQYGSPQTSYGLPPQYSTGGYSDTYGMPFSPYCSIRPGHCEEYNRVPNGIESRAVPHPASYDHSGYGLNLTHHQQVYPDFMFMADGRRGLPSSPRRMPRVNQPLMGVKADVNLEGEKKGKNKVLPKEAVAIMETWLRNHEENPYPNDEEKETLMKQTKLQMNQINYWFTNARRRKLPKWSIERQMAQEKSGNLQNPSSRQDDET